MPAEAGLLSVEALALELSALEVPALTAFRKSALLACGFSTHLPECSQSYDFVICHYKLTPQSREGPYCVEGEMFTPDPDRPNAAMADSHTILSLRLTPHRSLTRRNFHILLLIFSGACFFTSLPFILLGAWPVVGFMGLDVAAFYFAFRASFRAARAYEDVLLTPLELRFAKVSPTGARAEWHFNPSWVRLDRVEHEEFGTQRLAFVSHGRSVEVGPFLGPDEKASLARCLSAGLAEARRGPRFS